MSRFFANKLENLVPYTPGEQPKRTGELIKLNTNESPFAPSSFIEKALCNSEQIENLRLYPDPTCADFISELAKYYNVGKENITLGNGSDELLAFSFAAFCENGAAFADITYGFYSVFADLYSAKKFIIPLKQDFSIDVSEYAKINSTVFVANPNAPTGLALSLCKIENLVLQNKNRLVIVDEAYVDFGAQSAVQLTKKYDNLLIIGTFSKSRSLAGARIGYAIAHDDIIKDLNKVKFSFNPYNLNRLSLIAGINSVLDDNYFKNCCNEIINIREYTKKALLSMGFNLTNSMANFLFVSPPKGIESLSAKIYFDELRKKNIIVRHFNLPKIENYVRITIGTKQQMEKLISQSKQIIDVYNEQKERV